MYAKSDANEGGTYVMDLPALATSGKKMKANKAVFHDILTLPKNETLMPNFSYKVSNSDTLKPLINVVETQGKTVNGQPNVCNKI